MSSIEQVTARLDAATAGRRTLEHPFYKAWVAGTLTRDDLEFYAGQYWRHVEAFPSYLQDLGDRLPEGARDVVRANLADERDGDHAGLWLKFAAALGSEAGAVRAAGVEPETRACVERFAEACSQAPAPFALGMLYGYESQTPEVARTKVEGLREHYDIDGPGVEYFELHGELDIEHSRDLAAAIAATATGEGDLDSAAAGARAGAEAVWGLLDGVARVRAI